MKLAVLILVTLMVSPVMGLYINDEMHAYGDIRAPGVLPLPPECRYTPPPANQTLNTSVAIIGMVGVE